MKAFDQRMNWKLHICMCVCIVFQTLFHRMVGNMEQERLTTYDKNHSPG